MPAVVAVQPVYQVADNVRPAVFEYLAVVVSAPQHQDIGGVWAVEIRRFLHNFIQIGIGFVLWPQVGVCPARVEFPLHHVEEITHVNYQCAFFFRLFEVLQFQFSITINGIVVTVTGQ